MDSTEEPILSRLQRLDIMLRHLEEIRGCNRSSPKSSCASTPSSGTLISDGGNSSLASSPKSLEKHCRPMDDVVMETAVKGTLIDRVVQVENRVLKMEEILEAEKRRGEKVKKRAQKKKKKGLKELVKSCVTGKKKPNA